MPTDSFVGFALDLAVYFQKKKNGDVILFFCGTSIITTYDECAVKSNMTTVDAIDCAYKKQNFPFSSVRTF